MGLLKLFLLSLLDTAALSVGVTLIFWSYMTITTFWQYMSGGQILLLTLLGIVGSVIFGFSIYFAFVINRLSDGRF